VPTVQTESFQNVCEKFFLSKKNVFISGPSGCGKSVMVDAILARLGWLLNKKMCFSNATQISDVQQLIERNLNIQRRKGVIFLVPHKNQQLVIRNFAVTVRCSRSTT
jgi:DNA replication protein DnaC